MESALFAIMLVTVVYACFYAVREDDREIASKTDPASHP